MLKTILRPLAGVASLALLAALTVPAVAAPIGDDDGKKIHIKQVHACEGEDCEQGEQRAIFVGDGGELHELGELAGDDLVWVEAGEHGDHHVRIFGGSGAFLGVQLTDLTDELRTHFGAPEGQGVLVSKVVDGSPAAIAGVQVGDVITAVDGETVKGSGSLGHLIQARDEGETVALEVYRDGRIERLSPTLEKREMAGMPRMKMRRMHGKHGDVKIFGDDMHGMRKVMVKCDEEDGEKDCEVTVGDADVIAIGDFDCGGAETCKVEVQCGDDGCECTANGDAVDCDELPGFSERHGG